MASSRSEENVNLKLFQTPVGVTVLECPAILFGHWCFWMIGRCYCQMMFIMFESMADVIANHIFVADVFATVVHVWWNWHEARCYGHSCFLWLMLLSLVYWFSDWFYCNFWCWIHLADVIANDGKSLPAVARGTCPWLMLLPLWLVRLMLLPLWCF